MASFRKKLIVNSGIVFAIVVVLGVGLYIAVSKINKVGGEISALKNQARLAQREVKEFTRLKEDSAEARAALQVLRRALPERDDLLLFRTDMEHLARERNLRAGFSFGAEIAGDKEKPGYVNFNMSVEGGFASIISFIKDAESSGYLLELFQASVSGEGGNASGRLDGKVFFTQ